MLVAVQAIITSTIATCQILRNHHHKPAGSATALFGISTTDPIWQQSRNVLADVKILHLYLPAVDHVHNVVDRYAVTRHNTSLSVLNQLQLSRSIVTEHFLQHF